MPEPPGRERRKKRSVAPGEVGGGLREERMTRTGTRRDDHFADGHRSPPKGSGHALRGRPRGYHLAGRGTARKGSLAGHGPGGGRIGPASAIRPSGRRRARILSTRRRGGGGLRSATGAERRRGRVQFPQRGGG